MKQRRDLWFLCKGSRYYSGSYPASCLTDTETYLVDKFTT